MSRDLSRGSRPRATLSRGPRRLRLVPAVLGLVQLFPLPGNTQRSPAHIPEIHATSFAGQPVDLPSMLRNKAGVIILGFSRDSRDQAAEWGKRLSADFGSSDDVLYFELAMLEEVPRFLRGVVERSIARNVSDRGKAHFLVVTADEARWKALAHVQDDKAVYILVVDGTGAVRWQGSGQPTDEQYSAVRRALSGVLGH